MIRVGFIIDFDSNWLGGVNYFRNLVNAIYGLDGRELEVVVFTGRKMADSVFSGFPPIEIVRSAIFDRMSLSWVARKVVHRLFSRSYVTERLLIRHDIDVLSHSSFLGLSASIPTIGWIPDFQHLHLPDFFTAKELYLRNREFKNLCKHCSKLILSSHDALKDLMVFAPETVEKATVLQFCINPANLSMQIESISNLEARYGFSGKYFLLPNQFWVHKNHELVIRALSHLKETGSETLVLATGNTKDYRQPDHFEHLMRMARELGVESNFKVLGMVPLSDLVALMKHAIGIINPSLFEGWSTTVEEAKLMDKAVILSDINVHREQNPSAGYYFSPDDPLMLARHLQNLWDQPYVNELPEGELYEVAEQRFIRFAESYQKIVLEVATSYKHT